MTADERYWCNETKRLIAGRQILDVTYEHSDMFGENVLTICLEGAVKIQPLRDCGLNGVGALGIETANDNHTIPGTMRM
jgi:hypothetical protein